ncbi:MAG: GAF domain-containing protein, partial [Dehalococcoidia bacterium]
DMEKEEHSAVCYRGFSPELVGRIQRAKLGDDPVASEVVRTGHPVVLERVFEHPRVGEAARQEGIRSAFSAPLMSEGEVNGILAIATRRDHHFSKGDEEFIEAVGGQLGMAIKNAFLYDQSERQNRELSALITVGKVATSTFDLQDLLTLSLDTVLGVTTADAAEVWLIEQDDELIMRCTRGSYSEAFLEVPRFKVGEGVAGIVAQSGEPVVIADLPSDPSFVRRQVVEAGFHCFCAIPLRYRNRTVGVLTTAALSSEAVGKQDLRLLEGIGEWLALAIENARLYKDVQDAAVIQERERIAREMHDGMAQLLGYINTQTLAVKKRLANEDLAEAREELTKMEDVARDLYADVREGILGLRTVATRQAGFLPTIREYAQRYSEMCGIEVEINGVASGLPLLEPSAEIQLIRIIQEALANVRKHSRATRASVELDGSGNDLQVTIADNGRGFDLARLPGIGWPRFGLQSMRERAEAIGGSLNIGTAPGQGTRVTVRVPVLERKSSEHESPAR